MLDIIVRDRIQEGINEECQEWLVVIMASNNSGSSSRRIVGLVKKWKEKSLLLYRNCYLDDGCLDFQLLSCATR